MLASANAACTPLCVSCDGKPLIAASASSQSRPTSAQAASQLGADPASVDAQYQPLLAGGGAGGGGDGGGLGGAKVHSYEALHVPQPVPSPLSKLELPLFCNPRRGEHTSPAAHGLSASWQGSPVVHPPQACRE